MSDPLDDFLDRPFECVGNDALRGQLRQRTTAIVRRHRLVRRLSQAAALAACFLAGMTTMWFVMPKQAAPVAPTVVIVEKIVEPPPKEATMPQTGAVVEWKARLQPDQKVAELRRAAKVYLNEEHDYAASLRCYTQALDAGGPAALEFSPDDDWLEMSLKNARRKERS